MINFSQILDFIKSLIKEDFKYNEHKTLQEYNDILLKNNFDLNKSMLYLEKINKLKIFK